MSYWDQYARRWQADKLSFKVDDQSVKDDQKESYLAYLGDEWGTKAAVDQVVADFITPHLRTDSIVVEIGSGGGRMAARVAPQCGQLLCLDTSEEMLRLCENTLRDFENIVFLRLDPNADRLPIEGSSVDLVYAFDTLVHLDQRQIFRYLEEAARILKPAGMAVFHFASHETPNGWPHFAKAARSGGRGPASFEYVDSRAFFRMATKAGLKVVEDSLGRSTNFYYERDVVALFQPGNSHPPF